MWTFMTNLEDFGAKSSGQRCRMRKIVVLAVLIVPALLGRMSAFNGNIRLVAAARPCAAARPH